MASGAAPTAPAPCLHCLELGAPPGPRGWHSLCLFRAQQSLTAGCVQAVCPEMLPGSWAVDTLRLQAQLMLLPEGREPSLLGSRGAHSHCSQMHPRPRAGPGEWPVAALTMSVDPRHVCLLGLPLPF